MFTSLDGHLESGWSRHHPSRAARVQAADRFRSAAGRRAVDAARAKPVAILPQWCLVLAALDTFLGRLLDSVTGIARSKSARKTRNSCGTNELNAIGFRDAGIGIAFATYF
jgi:hypothetical protein